MTNPDGESNPDLIEYLDQGQDGGRAIHKTDQRSAEAEAASWLLEQRIALDPRPAFVRLSRQRLLARITSQEAAHSRAVVIQRRVRLFPLNLQGWRRPAFQFVSLLLLICMLLYNCLSISRASLTWLPGDPTYPLLTALENGQLLISTSRLGDARLHIRFAFRRLIEVQALAFENRYSEIPDSVANFSEHIRETMEIIAELEQENPAQARLIASDLHSALSRQTEMVVLLAGFAPQSARPDFDRLVAISASTLSSLQDVLTPGSSEVPGLSQREYLTKLLALILWHPVT